MLNEQKNNPILTKAIPNNKNWRKSIETVCIITFIQINIAFSQLIEIYDRTEHVLRTPVWSPPACENHMSTDYGRPVLVKHVRENAKIFADATVPDYHCNIQVQINVINTHKHKLFIDKSTASDKFQAVEIFTFILRRRTPWLGIIQISADYGIVIGIQLFWVLDHTDINISTSTSRLSNRVHLTKSTGNPDRPQFPYEFHRCPVSFARAQLRMRQALTRTAIPCFIVNMVLLRGISPFKIISLIYTVKTHLWYR